MDFEIKNTKTGNGLFTKKYLEGGNTVLRFVGNTIETKDIPDLSHISTYNLIQIGMSLYLNVEGHFSFFINHSCNPNTKLVIQAQRAFLIALRDILPEEQLTFDYSTSSTEDKSTFLIKCKCGSINCRNTISGFYELPLDIQAKLKKENKTVYYI